MPKWMNHVCPRCGGTYTGYLTLSRVDDQTEICGPCGTREALQAFAEVSVLNRDLTP
jgi:hypothetical protein